MVVIDTSALIAATDRTDPNHTRATIFFQAEPGPIIIPTGILAEISYFLESRFGAQALDHLLVGIENGDFLLECGDSDISRVLELTRRYHDQPLGYSDAAVIACAERNGGRVATFDLRHFAAVAREGTIQIVP